MTNTTIYWKAIDDRAIIPTKRTEDAGFDIYTYEDDVVLQPTEKHLFHTGLKYVITTPNIWLMAFDRGSTGSKGIHVHCGVCDNGYRGEVFVCLSNDNSYPVVFTSKVDKVIYDTDKNVLYYPISKGICQLIPVEMPQVSSCEADEKLWAKLEEVFESERGESKLGQSGK